MDSQVILFLLIFGGIQGVLLLLFFIQRKLYNSSCIFLILYLGTLLLQVTLKVMNKIWLMENWQSLYNFSHFIPLLYGPLLYLFVKHFYNTSSFQKKDLLHFIPASFFFLFIIFSNYDFHRQLLPVYFLFRPQVRLILLLSSLGIYHYYAYQVWKQHRQAMQHHFSDTINQQFHWIKQLVFVSLITGILISAALYLLYIYYPRGHEYRYAFVVLSICIYWVSYTALTRPSVFSVIKGNGQSLPNYEYSMPALKVLKQPARYANSTLTAEEAGDISLRLEKLMTGQKLYLQADLSISRLADVLNCSRHHLSQVLNDKLQLSYNDYINGLRVAEAKQLLLDENNSQVKIASLAYDAGFNSLSTFNDVFKKMTGKTPSDFRKESLKEQQKQRV